MPRDTILPEVGKVESHPYGAMPRPKCTLHTVCLHYIEVNVI